jgi:amino acid transporter
MNQTSRDLDGRLHHRRVLTLWDLIFYGIVLIEPIAPVPLYGVAEKLSNGHFVTTILIAMLAMMATAFSYGRMAALYPAAGSAYTYVGKGLNPYLGFLAGWAMFLDYLLIPLIQIVWIATAIHARYLPQVPYAAVAATVAALMTFMNLRGIKSSARANQLLLTFMSIVIGSFVISSVRYLFGSQGWNGIFSIQPFYDPTTFNFHTIRTATSFAALTYIGFDGVTTLAEDVEDPKRNVLLATVAVCVFTGVIGGLETYLAQRIWPDWHIFSNVETAFMDVCRRAGGFWLYEAMGAVLLLAAFGSGLNGHLSAAKLLFGMGRDNVLPRKIFGHVDKRKTPTINLWIISIVAFGGALVLDFEKSGELINFGAFLAFMGVNAATFWQFMVIGQEGRKRNLMGDAVIPLAGFLFCAWIWWGLENTAKIIGGIWFILGLLYLASSTHGFQTAPAVLYLGEMQPEGLE